MRKILLVLFLVLALPAPAQAHSALVRSIPAAGSELTNFPTRIVLEFNEALLTLGDGEANSVTLTSPTSKEISMTLPLIQGNRISTKVMAAPSEIGNYTVSYRVVSQDGHPITGSYSFAFTTVGDEVTPQPVTTTESPDELKENGETGKALIVFAILAALALIAYRTFIGRR